MINICPSALEAVVRAAPPAGAEALGVADVAALAEFGSLLNMSFCELAPLKAK